MEASMQAHAEKHGFITPLKLQTRHEAMSISTYVDGQPP
jgi:hypothetical protein